MSLPSNNLSDQEARQGPLTAEERRGLVGWFATNHVAANLLMLFLFVGGLASMLTLNAQLFPDSELNDISINVVYPGASPEEVEDGVTSKIEEAIDGTDGVGRIVSVSGEGLATITAELSDDADPDKALDDIKQSIDSLTTLPVDAERPMITKPLVQELIVSIAVFGNASERVLVETAQQLQFDLMQQPQISKVSMSNARDFEISIEVSEETLQRLGLSFDDVGDAIARSSMDLAGGSVRSDSGEILIRSLGQRYEGKEFESIVLRANADGTFIRVGDVAKVKDGFDEAPTIAYYKDQQAILLNVFRIGEQNTIDVAAGVKDFLATKSRAGELPPGVNAEVWMDISVLVKDRISLLNKNALMGLALVLASLAMFLSLRLAFWTAAGIFVAFCGTFAAMFALGVTINMVSLFAFIIVLGIVVDDAIIIGENIFAYREQGYSPQRAAIMGAREMAIPVTMAVLTTMVTFTPLYFTEGEMARMFHDITLVVIPILALSLVECLLILPAHLSGGKAKPIPTAASTSSGLTPGEGQNMGRFQQAFAATMQRVINGPYRRMIRKVIEWRYFSISVATCIFFLCMGILATGYVKFSFFSPVSGDEIVMAFNLPQGSTTVRKLKWILPK